MSKSLVLKPRMSEKTYGLSKVQNTYVFDVDKSANKLQVAEAVAVQYGVKVMEVNIAIIKGKVKQTYRKRSRPTTGKRSDVKKAYVRLAEGDTIPVFDAIDEAAEQQEKTAAQAAKVADKQAKKSASKESK
jgi:large subunit ribosomal protein L23